MASILKVDELQGIVSAGNITVTSEGGSATQSLQQGLAKSWVTVNQTGTQAVRDSLNVSSITDVQTGSTTVTVSNAMSNSDFSMTNGIHTPSGITWPAWGSAVGGATPSTTIYQIGAWDYTGNYLDTSYNHGTIHGDLA